TSKDLGKITLPKFDGEPAKYHQWWSEFKFLVHKNSKVKHAIKFLHLRRCLSGKAKSYIEELTPSKQNYKKVIRRLREHYENVNTQRESFRRKIMELSMVTDEFDKEKLRQLLTEAELLYRRAKELNFSSEYVNGELMFEIKQLFPFQMQRNV